MSSPPTKHTRHVTWTCGAQGRLVSPDLDQLEHDIEFLETRMCPNCQLKEGDITPREFDILLANAAEDLADSLARDVVEELLRKHLKDIARDN